jgi:hypothetical protein
MSKKYGVRAVTVEQAYKWVEAATGLTAIPHESSFLGGDYYVFRSVDGAVLKLVSNKDIHDGEPVVSGCDGWEIVLICEGFTETSSLHGALANDYAHFQKL